MPGRRHERGTNQLREDVGYAFPKQLNRLVLPRSQRRSGRIQIRHVVAGQVLYLHQAPGPAPRVGPVKLEQPPDAAITADRTLHGLVFLNAGFCHLLAQLEYPLHGLVSGYCNKRRHGLLVKAFYIEPGGRFEPRLELRHTVWIVEPGERFGFGK